MSKTKTTIELPQEERVHLLPYILGFGLSIYFTLAAYLLVVRREQRIGMIMAVIISLALAQFAVQIVCFLHLGQERRPRWKLFAFLTMISVALVVVFGSLWIMDNLNDRMTPDQMNKYVQSQDGL